MPPSRVLDALKSPVKVGLSTRGLVQENLRGHFENDADELFSCETLQFNTVRLMTLHHMKSTIHISNFTESWWTFAMQVACEASLNPSIRALLLNCVVSCQATCQCE